MCFLELVIKETLRLFPVGGLIARRLTKDIVLGIFSIDSKIPSKTYFDRELRPFQRHLCLRPHSLPPPGFPSLVGPFDFRL
jgi:hypothetical protein